jgi:hypothetical protein
VSECDRESSIMRRPLPTRGCWNMVKKCIYMAIGIYRIYRIYSKSVPNLGFYFMSNSATQLLNDIEYQAL